MSQNLAIDRERFEELCKLWDELSDFGLHQAEAASIHCMRRICGMIDAKNAFWVGSVRMCEDTGSKKDLMHGWRIRSVNFIDQFYHAALRPPVAEPAEAGGEAEVMHNATAESEGGTKSYHLKSEVKDLGMTTFRLTETAGRFRAYRLHAGELVDVKAFSKTEHYKIAYAKLGIRDRIWVVFPVSNDAESTFVFDRIGEQGEFSDAEMELAASALSGIKWFHRQLLLSHGLGLCQEAITPSEHRVKQELLAGAAERDIAQKLNLSPGTVHQYATRIYRKYGVQGRAEFMSLWLSGG